MNIDITISNVCKSKRGICENCSSHFMFVRPSINGVSVSRHFVKDMDGDEEQIRQLIMNVLDCSTEDFNELHKFEENIDGVLVFRTKAGKSHIVYAVSKEHRIIFLRKIKNFKEYKRFLEDKGEIRKMVASSIDLLSHL
jgi:mRNA-degrading endonuclease RelE of RelBE toxin-antitoxin system